MDWPKYLRVSVLTLVWSGVCGGCHSREVVRFESHPTQPVLLVETVEKRNYLVTATAERVFWRCPERGGAVVCERECGGGTGYACPSGVFFSNGLADEVR
jgi:hypothetical protein